MFLLNLTNAHGKSASCTARSYKSTRAIALCISRLILAHLVIHTSIKHSACGRPVPRVPFTDPNSFAFILTASVSANRCCLLPGMNLSTCNVQRPISRQRWGSTNRSESDKVRMITLKIKFDTNDNLGECICRSHPLFQAGCCLPALLASSCYPLRFRCSLQLCSPRLASCRAVRVWHVVEMGSFQYHVLILWFIPLQIFCMFFCGFFF